MRLSVVPATLAGTLAVGAALLLPGLSASDPDAGAQVPGLGSPSWWCAVAVLLAQACALLWVRGAPRGVLIAVTALPALLVLIAPGGLFSLTSLVVIVTAFLAVLARPDRRTGAFLAIAFALVAGGQFANELRMGDLAPGLALGASLLQAGLVVGTPVLVGVMVAARRDARDARVGESTALEREREMLVQAAAARERTAMSRELHDIAAHHMSGIALMASAIDRQIDSDPLAAKRSAGLIREQSRTVLEDLRRVVGLLRVGAEDGRSVETLPAVRELVEARRSAGAEVDLVLHPAADGRALGTGIGALTQLVAYRMVQEALANAATHAAGARCVVTIDDRGEDLVLLVSNDEPRAAEPGPDQGHGQDQGHGGGFGLLGMRERAQMVGADLSYGPTAAGGWEVRLAVSRERDSGSGRHPAVGELS